MSGKANETMAFYFNKHDEDRALFVHNLGELLAQTNVGVKSCVWEKETDTVIIDYSDGCTRSVNVRMDSYVAIIRDVAKKV